MPARQQLGRGNAGRAIMTENYETTLRRRFRGHDQTYSGAGDRLPGPPAIPESRQPSPSYELYGTGPYHSPSPPSEGDGRWLRHFQGVSRKFGGAASALAGRGASRRRRQRAG